MKNLWIRIQIHILVMHLDPQKCFKPQTLFLGGSAESLNFVLTMNKAPKPGGPEGWAPSEGAPAVAKASGGGPTGAKVQGSSQAPLTTGGAKQQNKGNRSRNNSFGEGRPKVMLLK